MVLQALAEHRLGGRLAAADATPRRLYLSIEEVISRQPDSEELVLGPPVSVAFKDGKPTGAALGFARKNGLDVSALRTEVNEKGEYVAFVRQIEGRDAAGILSHLLPGLIPKIYFPKTMYWTSKNGPFFIRPIRWLIALLGEQVIQFEIAGVHSGATTLGHRRMASGPIAVTPATYAERLAAHGVIVSAEERRRRILDGIARLTEGTGLTVKTDEGLLDTLVYITELPTPILGAFDRKYLALPEEVLVTVMRHHQKYFSLADREGNLAPHFIAVMNIAGDPEGIVRQGNERVLQARFNDAGFFWDVDQRRTLADRVPDLGNVTFQAKLGSYLDKTNRMVALIKELGGDAQAERAALLSKCDLITEMVKEFTELQGVIGGLYARAQGEPAGVSEAIYEHYKPLSMEDAIPSTPVGRLVALADKIDTLRGCFAVGMIPSGSKDPFALRRAAQGVVRILVEGNLPIPVSSLARSDAALLDFFLDRVRYYFKEVLGYRYDEVNAVLGSGWDNLPAAAERLAALQAVRPTEHFEPLAASFKRIKNILTQAEFGGGGPVAEELLEAGPERTLYDAFHRVRSGIGELGHREALESIASLRPDVDRFFDKVLVNAPDERVRQNRLALLASLLTEFSAIADFSEIVTSS
jgi:glycyl-tRNA synthetase beta chain